MANHPAIDLVSERIVKDQIGGAADTAKEVMSAMAQVASDSQATTLDGLYKDMDAAAVAVLKILPSFANPINVLHMMMGTLETDMANGVDLAQTKQHLLDTKAKFDHFMETAFEKMSNVGAELINEGDTAEGTNDLPCRHSG